MKSIKSILTVFTLALTAVSCNLLDVENPSGIYGSGFWKTKGEVESYLAGTYTSFRSCCNTMEHFETRSEVFFGGNEGSGSNQWAQNLTALNGVGWGAFYTVVQHCNMIIRHIDDVKYADVAEKNDILAQVYTMRAYMYFSLIRLWGKVPLELEATEGSDKPKLERSSCEDVMDRILTDIETAVGLYPSDSWANGKSKASLKAAYALKADALLWKAKVLGGTEKDLESVIEYAGLAAAGTSLEDDFSDIYGTKEGQEVIWSIHFGHPEIEGHYSKDMTLRDVFVETAVNKDEIPYAKTGTRSSYSPSDRAREFLARYSGDVRNANAYIDAVDKDGKRLGTSQNKMRGTATETNRMFDNDIILYRHAEMILFKAEALAALDRVPEAIEELNIIRNRAKIGDYSGPTDRLSVEKEILEERGREFWLENKRWPDLLRFHSEGVIDVYEFVPNLKDRKDAGVIVPLYYAIPLSEMSLNHKLKQTEGYE